MLPLIIAIVALLLVFRIFVPTFLDSGNLLDLSIS
jgi:ribose/xylose/arabinose/galactoside ABC-type transport system permease subunit